MADKNASELRIAELEAQIAHQEATIQELSDAAAKQWDTLDALVVQVNDLKDRIKALEDEAKSPAQADDTPPPHY